MTNGGIKISYVTFLYLWNEITRIRVKFMKHARDVVQMEIIVHKLNSSKIRLLHPPQSIIIRNSDMEIIQRSLFFLSGHNQSSSCTDSSPSPWILRSSCHANMSQWGFSIINSAAGLFLISINYLPSQRTQTPTQFPMNIHHEWDYTCGLSWVCAKSRQLCGTINFPSTEFDLLLLRCVALLDKNHKPEDKDKKLSFLRSLSFVPSFSSAVMSLQQ